MAVSAETPPRRAAARPALRHSDREGVDVALREDFRRTLILGRWLLVIAQAAVSAILLVERSPDAPTLEVIIAMALYYGLSLILVYRVPLKPWLLLAALTCDLFLTAAAAYQTGGERSPFLGQYFLIIFAGALIYDIAGGVIVGVFASLVATLLAVLTQPTDRLEAFRSLANLVPYYVMGGWFAGALVQRIRVLLRGDYELRLREGSARRELSLARSVQLAALPEGPPDIPGLDCSVINRYAAEVGGDFLMFLRPEADGVLLHPSRIDIVIGDVSGKGIPAALASTSIAHLLPWLLRARGQVKKALQLLNDDLLDRLPEESYATLIFAEIDPELGVLRLWTAGHPPAIYYQKKTGKALQVVTSELPLGMFPDWNEDPVTLLWEPGDVLLLYTDGLNETHHDETREVFGSERIAAILEAHAEETTAEIVAALRQAVLAWGTPNDDLTLVACKRVVPAAAPKATL